MDVRQIAITPVGKLTIDDIRPAVERAAKGFRQPLELRPQIELPAGTIEGERNQARAAKLIGALHEQRLRTQSGTMVGAEEGKERPLKRPEAWIYVTDVDLYTANSGSVFASLNRKVQVAVVSVRRIRESFYKRPPEPNKQRGRLVKEILRMAGRLADLAECKDPRCALATTRGVPDLDTKQEMFCRNCASILFKGRINL